MRANPTYSLNIKNLKNSRVLSGSGKALLALILGALNVSVDLKYDVLHEFCISGLNRTC